LTNNYVEFVYVDWQAAWATQGSKVNDSAIAEYGWVTLCSNMLYAYDRTPVIDRDRGY